MDGCKSKVKQMMKDGFKLKANKTNNDFHCGTKYSQSIKKIFLV
jgi:hypothetical protein